MHENVLFHRFQVHPSSIWQIQSVENPALGQTRRHPEGNNLVTNARNAEWVKGVGEILAWPTAEINARIAGRGIALGEIAIIQKEGAQCWQVISTKEIATCAKRRCTKRVGRQK